MGLTEKEWDIERSTVGLTTDPYCDLTGPQAGPLWLRLGVESDLGFAAVTAPRLSRDALIDAGLLRPATWRVQPEVGPREAAYVALVQAKGLRDAAA